MWRAGDCSTTRPANRSSACRYGLMCTNGFPRPDVPIGCQCSRFPPSPPPMRAAGSSSTTCPPACIIFTCPKAAFNKAETACAFRTIPWPVARTLTCCGCHNPEQTTRKHFGSERLDQRRIRPTTPADSARVFAQARDHRGQQDVLGGVDLVRELLRRIRVLDTHGGLVQNRTAVHLGGDIMHGATGDLDAPTEGLADAVEARKTRQQAGMQVDDLARKGFEKARFNHPHEARE